MNDRRNDEDLAVPRQRSDEGDVLETPDAEVRAQEAWVEEGGAWDEPAVPHQGRAWEAPAAPHNAPAIPHDAPDVSPHGPAVRQEGAPLRESGPSGQGEPSAKGASPSEGLETGGPTESTTTGGVERLRERWRDVQSSFVDEPREAVKRADGLVDEVVTTLTTELRHRWKDPAQPDTEQLRLALRDYRKVFERLLTNEVI